MGSSTPKLARENEITKQEKELLTAIIEDGAKYLQPHLTTVAALILRAKWPDNKNSAEMIVRVLRNLLKAGYSIQNGGLSLIGSMLSSVETAENGQVKLILNIPPAILEKMISVVGDTKKI